MLSSTGSSCRLKTVYLANRAPAKAVEPTPKRLKSDRLDLHASCDSPRNRNLVP